MGTLLFGAMAMLKCECDVIWAEYGRRGELFWLARRERENREENS